MAVIETIDNTIYLTDNESGERVLLNPLDVYQNLTELPLFPVEDNRESIGEKFILVMGRLGRLGERGDTLDIPDHETGHIMYISMIFAACMERNQPLNILLDPGLEFLKGVIEDILLFFGREYQLQVWNDGGGRITGSIPMENTPLLF